MNERPIGVFDSGIGGLTVVAAIRRTLPNERVLYFGDTARLPYGNKSVDTVTRFSREITRFLVRRDVKALVVACNSASAMALGTLARELTIPVLGVIEPGATAALARTRTGRVGVIGTSATVRSNAYREALTARRADVAVVQVATPLLVHLVEEGWVDGDVPRRVVEHYLTPFGEGRVDTVILGCTHYPLLTGTIASVLDANVELVDSAGETANALERLVREHDLAAPDRVGGGELECFASDAATDFARLGERFLGHPLHSVRTVEQSDVPWYER